jgi:hypothetical protein
MRYIPGAEYDRAISEFRSRLPSLPRSGDNSHVAFAIIDVCLDRGLNTKRQICQISIGLGENERQVMEILDLSTGKSPELFPWYVENGRYWKHPSS